MKAVQIHQDGETGIQPQNIRMECVELSTNIPFDQLCDWANDKKSGQEEG